MKYCIENLNIRKFLAAMSMLAIIVLMHFAEGNRTFFYYSKPKETATLESSWNKRHILFFENIPPMKVNALVYNKSQEMNHYLNTNNDITLIAGLERIIIIPNIPHTESGKNTSDFMFKEVMHAIYASLISAVPSLISYLFLEFIL